MSTTTSDQYTPGRVQGQVWTIDRGTGPWCYHRCETAAAILGIGRTKAYELAKTNEFPVRLLRIGRRYLVPVPAILKLLAVE